MSGKPIEQFPLLWIGRQVSDQRALGRLCQHLFQVQFHVLHRPPPRRRLIDVKRNSKPAGIADETTLL